MEWVERSRNFVNDFFKNLSKCLSFLKLDKSPKNFMLSLYQICFASTLHYIRYPPKKFLKITPRKVLSMQLTRLVNWNEQNWIVLRHRFLWNLILIMIILIWMIYVPLTNLFTINRTNTGCISFITRQPTYASHTRLPLYIKPTLYAFPLF